MSSLITVILPQGYVKPEKKSSYPLTVDNCFKQGDMYYYVTREGEVQSHEVTSMIFSVYNTGLKSEQIAEAFVAFMQLKTLCDTWNENDGFVPNFTDTDDYKYCVRQRNNAIEIFEYKVTNSPLAFKYSETAVLFLIKFKELLEIAKPLI